MKESELLSRLSHSTGSSKQKTMSQYAITKNFIKNEDVKTIGGESIVGDGDIDVVMRDEVADVAFSGDYKDLRNAPGSNPFVVGTCSTDGEYNEITLEGINLQEALDLEVGDVIKVNSPENIKIPGSEGIKWTGSCVLDGRRFLCADGGGIYVLENGELHKILGDRRYTGIVTHDANYFDFGNPDIAIFACEYNGKVYRIDYDPVFRDATEVALTNIGVNRKWVGIVDYTFYIVGVIEDDDTTVMYIEGSTLVEMDSAFNSGVGHSWSGVHFNSGEDEVLFMVDHLEGEVYYRSGISMSPLGVSEYNFRRITQISRRMAMLYAENGDCYELDTSTGSITKLDVFMKDSKYEPYSGIFYLEDGKIHRCSVNGIESEETTLDNYTLRTVEFIGDGVTDLGEDSRTVVSSVDGGVSPPFNGVSILDGDVYYSVREGVASVRGIWKQDGGIGVIYRVMYEDVVGNITNVVTDGDNYYFTADNRHIYRVNNKNWFDITQFSDTTRRFHCICMNMDNTYLYAGSWGGKINKIDMSTGAVTDLTLVNRGWWAMTLDTDTGIIYAATWDRNIYSSEDDFTNPVIVVPAGTQIAGMQYINNYIGRGLLFLRRGGYPEFYDFDTQEDRILTKSMINVSNNYIGGIGMLGDRLYLARTGLVASHDMRDFIRSIPTGSIITNYEHSHNRGSGPLVLETRELIGNVRIERFKKWHEAILGIGQGWVELLTSDLRKSGVTYLNSTGRYIQLIAYKTTGGTGDGIYIDDKWVSYVSNGSSQTSTFTILIPPGSTYRIDSSNITGTWSELR